MERRGQPYGEVDRTEEQDWYVAMEDGKPSRQTVITYDDMVDLQIALNTATTLDEFLELV